MNLEIHGIEGDYIFWTLDGQDGKSELNEDHTSIYDASLCGGPFDMKPDTMKRVREEVQQWLDEKPSRDEDYAEWNQRYEYYRDVWNVWGNTPAGHGIDHAFPSIYHLPDEVAVEGEVAFIYHGCGDDDIYISEPVTSPTWGMVMRLFDNAIKKTGDLHHCFLEGVAETHKKGIWTFCSGS